MRSKQTHLAIDAVGERIRSYSSSWACCEMTGEDAEAVGWRRHAIEMTPQIYHQQTSIEQRHVGIPIHSSERTALREGHSTLFTNIGPTLQENLDSIWCNLF